MPNSQVRKKLPFKIEVLSEFEYLVMYSGENDVCVVSLSLYSHRAS